MQSYLAGVNAPPDATTNRHAPSEAQRKARGRRGVARWRARAHHLRASILERGTGPPGRSEPIASAALSAVRKRLAAFTVVRLRAQQAAARLFP